MSKILVTGGCGYIGIHTLVDLIDSGFEVVSIDNHSRSEPSILKGATEITGKTIQNYGVDLCNLAETEAVFQDHPDIYGIIHFAAFKSVPESVGKPLMYYHNNINSLLNILSCCQKYSIRHFVFSSSCSVYGNAEVLPVTESTPLRMAESPYGYTKQVGERITADFTAVTQTKCISLRYFNPVGAHSSAKIGEMPYGTPENLVPFITQTAMGKREQLTVYGDDYNTRDGTCIRDYIHVMDIAHAHTLALQFLEGHKNAPAYDVFNLGIGEGVSVMEAVRAFESASKMRLNYTIGPRRPGDVEAIYANNNKAKEVLGWNPERDLPEMMLSAWQWEQALANG